MHSVWARLNAVVFFGLTVLLGFASLAAFSTYLHRASPTVEYLRLNKIRSFRVHSGVDRALLNFDLKADLRGAFNWNIKQLFVYVTAQYASDTNPLNQIILWDKIVESPEEAVLDMKNVFVEYALIDQGSELRGKDVTLHLHWDHMPLTGRIYEENRAMETFTMSEEYKSTSPTK